MLERRRQLNSYPPDQSAGESTFWDSSSEGPMPKTRGQSSNWVKKEAAKHTTPASMRQRIAREFEQIRVLTGAGFNGDMGKAVEAHHELIRILTERLAAFDEGQSGTG